VPWFGRIESIFEPYFSGFRIFLFDTSFSNPDPGQLEMNFKKPREVFSQNKMIYKNLPHILHIYLILGESKTSLDPMFSKFREANLLNETDGNRVHEGKYTRCQRLRYTW
jgi:hypothetical protein